MRMLSLLSIAEQDDQVVDIFTKPLSEAKFIKLHMMLGIQEAAIMGGCPTDVISPPESPELCVDGGVLEHQVLMVHHTSPRISRSVVDLHMEIVGRVIDQISTSVGRVVDKPIGQTKSTNSQRQLVGGSTN
jgi:hypothetical protein